MARTTWLITDFSENSKTELIYYHFGKEPKFPTWYMKENHIYQIKMTWNFKLLWNLKLFFKCLTHSCIIKAA